MDFQWDERNLRHVLTDRPHGVTPRLVEIIAEGIPRIFQNRPDVNRSGSSLMIGPDDDQRFWTVILLEIGDDLWRPMTGWPSTNSEIRLYREADDDQAT